jgi:glycine oxidase
METYKSADNSFDVAIVGGGVIGLSLARALRKRGLSRVCVIESNEEVGLEASSAAGGMLAPQAEANEAGAFFQLASASLALYPHFVEELTQETGIDSQLERTGTLYLAFTNRDIEEIEERYEWQRRAGLQIEKLTADEARRLEPLISDKVCAALRFPRDVQVDNYLLVKALSVACEKLCVTVSTSTKAESVLIENNRALGVETSRGKVEARKVVIACGPWVSLLKSSDNSIKPVNIEPVRGQMLCLDAKERIIKHVIYSPRGYIVPRLDGKIVAGSTTECVGFEKSVTLAGLHTITTNTLEIAPSLSQLPLIDSWSGLRPRSADEMPIIGALSKTEGLYYAAGHFRNGILLAPITADTLAEEITKGTRSPLLEPFTPDRF